eukprot:4716211-Amphidinium_carterae.1
MFANPLEQNRVAGSRASSRRQGSGFSTNGGYGAVAGALFMVFAQEVLHSNFSFVATCHGVLRNVLEMEPLQGSGSGGGGSSAGSWAGGSWGGGSYAKCLACTNLGASSKMI